jgi:hypothetical protein
MPDYAVFDAQNEPTKADAGFTPETPKAVPAAGAKGGSSLPDMFTKIEGESTFLGRIASKIPGFDGYMERGRRREADQIIRDTIAARLEEERMKLSNAHQELSRDIVKAMDFAEPLGRADSRMMGLVNKIKSAPQGYAGFFDAVKIKEDDLAHIYEFDAHMMGYVDEIAADVAAVQSAVYDNGDIGGTIRALDASVQEASSTFNSRQELLSGVA